MPHLHTVHQSSSAQPHPESEALDIALYLLGRLLETQRENSRLRLELNRTRVRSRVLQGRLDMRVRQLSELVTSIREFVRLYRSARAAAGDNDEMGQPFSRFISLESVADSENETSSNSDSARAITTSSQPEDWIDLEEDAQRPYSLYRGSTDRL